LLTLETLAFLRSAEGRAELAAAAELDLGGASFLMELTRLRRRLPADRAAAVLDQTLLRRRALRKFALAQQMLFTAEGLEQASGEALAAHSAARFAPYGRVADCCCGLGGDSLALARHAQVLAFDRDPVRLACAEHNAAVYGLADKIRFRLADVEKLELSEVNAIFFDPSRRAGGRRIFSLAAYHPPVSLIERWQPYTGAIGVKVAPGVDHDEIVWECEQEFVAEGPDLKEGLLWFGPLATTTRRATMLPEGATLTAGSAAAPPMGEPSAWLYDPSPAVTRAGLVWELAALLKAQQLDPALAYLTGPTLAETPFAQAFRVLEWMPFNLKRLKARLRALGAGRVEVRRRGSPIEPEVLERRLRHEGHEPFLVFLTRMQGTSIAIVCRQAGG
jgi:SAM-dependent methyltransferase